MAWDGTPDVVTLIVVESFAGYDSVSRSSIISGLSGGNDSGLSSMANQSVLQMYESFISNFAI